jgi:hypothetical protein
MEFEDAQKSRAPASSDDETSDVGFEVSWLAPLAHALWPDWETDDKRVYMYKRHTKYFSVA